MASLRCHGDSDCNKTQIIRNFHLYIIQLWKPFFHISTHGDVINAQTWQVPPQKIQSSHLKAKHMLNGLCQHEKVTDSKRKGKLMEVPRKSLELGTDSLLFRGPVQIRMSENVRTLIHSKEFLKHLPTKQHQRRLHSLKEPA